MASLPHLTGLNLARLVDCGVSRRAIITADRARGAGEVEDEEGLRLV